jgi:hypothetical protein
MAVGGTRPRENAVYAIDMAGKGAIVDVQARRWGEIGVAENLAMPVAAQQASSKTCLCRSRRIYRELRGNNITIGDSDGV